MSIRGSFSAARAQIGRVGIVSQLLTTSLLSVMIAVAVVQTWTLHTVEQVQLRTAQQALDTNLAVLKRELNLLGTEWQIADGRLMLGGTPITGRDEVVDAVRQVAGGVATIFAGDERIATNVVRPDGGRAIGTRLAPGAARDAAIGRGETFRGRADILGVPHLTVYEPLRDRSGRQLGILFVGVSLKEAEAAGQALIRGGVIASLLVVLAVGIIYWLMLRATLRPLRGLAQSVRAIAGGQLEQPAPCASRTDQLGEIGRAIEVLREGSLRAQILEERAAVDRAARDRRQVSMDQLTQAFGTTVSGVLAKLGRSAEELRGRASGMAGSAERTRADMAGTAAEAEGSSHSLATVAAAAEELTASVGEISRQVGEAATFTQQAVTQARTTGDTVHGLSEAAGQIGDVVQLIRAIAGQTNLLALNATIEAARAGEAGKGFAVVASEVKNLAAQTALATGRIEMQVTGIQAATAGAVDAVRSVAGAIGRVSEAAAAISAAVSEQGIATREIAAQVQGVSCSTSAATAAMREAATAAEGTEATSRAVLGTAGQLSVMSSTLREEVEHFLTAMRASETANDRSGYERVPGYGAPAALQCSTYGSGTAEVADISLGGATLHCEWPCDVGAEVLVGLPGPGEMVSARIVDSKNGVLEVAFRQDRATLTRIEVALKAVTIAGSLTTTRQSA